LAFTRENPYKDEEKTYRGERLSKLDEAGLETWRIEWKEKGPVEFAYKVLKVDPIMNKPLQLSEGQTEFLIDLWKNGIKKAIISAGRGAGKTFVLAIYILWRICTHQYWDISSMGGSTEQSEKIQRFITGWKIHIVEIRKIIKKDVRRKVKTRAPSEAIFMSCSGASVRGPHTVELVIDEECEAEKQGNTKEVRAALWEVSTSIDFHIIKSSTAHFVHGDFLYTWTHAKELGYKRYRWAIAKHISGNEDIYQTFTDQNPENWISAVPWIPNENIRELRKEKSNDEWLVEALGGIGIMAGLVFNQTDFGSYPFGIICDRCDICKPYEEKYCPLIQFVMELIGVPNKDIPRSTKEALQYIVERVESVDWGRYEPCAYGIFGSFKNLIFVLHAEELVVANDDLKVERVVELANQWEVSIIRPDPAQFPFNNELINRGFAVHELFSFEGGQEKLSYIHCAKKHVERHWVIIPKAFNKLIESLRSISWDDKGKIRKENDHSFDMFIYGISYYCEHADIGDFWSAEDNKGKPKIEGVPPLWGKEYV